MSGSLTHGSGESVPGIPGAYATRNFAYLVRGPLSTLPLHEPMVILSIGLYGTLLNDIWIKISIIFNQEINCIWKCDLQYGDHFVQAHKCTSWYMSTRYTYAIYTYIYLVNKYVKWFVVLIEIARLQCEAHGDSGCIKRAHLGPVNVVILEYNWLVGDFKRFIPMILSTTEIDVRSAIQLECLLSGMSV